MQLEGSGAHLWRIRRKWLVTTSSKPGGGRFSMSTMAYRTTFSWSCGATGERELVVLQCDLLTSYCRRRFARHLANWGEPDQDEVSCSASVCALTNLDVCSSLCTVAILSRKHIQSRVRTSALYSLLRASPSAVARICSTLGSLYAGSAMRIIPCAGGESQP